MTLETPPQLPQRQENPFNAMDLPMVRIPTRASPFIVSEISDLLRTPPLQPSGPERTFTNVVGKPYRGPLFLQGDEDTCLGLAITHSTFALGEQPNPDITTALLNAGLPSEVNPGGMDIKDAPVIANHEQNPIALEILPPLYDGTEPVLDQNGLETQLEEVISSTIGSGKKLVVALADTPYQGQTDEKTHSVCLTAYRIPEGSQMQIQVIDSLTGPRVDTLARLTTQIANAQTPMLTVAKSPVQIPHGMRNIGK